MFARAHVYVPRPLIEDRVEFTVLVEYQVLLGINGTYFFDATDSRSRDLFFCSLLCLIFLYGIILLQYIIKYNLEFRVEVFFVYIPLRLLIKNTCFSCFVFPDPDQETDRCLMHGLLVNCRFLVVEKNCAKYMVECHIVPYYRC